MLTPRRDVARPAEGARLCPLPVQGESSLGNTFLEVFWFAATSRLSLYQPRGEMAEPSSPCLGSDPTRHRIEAVRSEFPANGRFVTAHRPTPALGSGAGCLRLPCSLAPCSESAPVPRSLQHGGTVDQSGTWVRDRFLAAREASRSVFDHPANAREIPAAATALGSRHASAGPGERDERGRVPRGRTVDLAGPRRAGALRLNKKAY